MQNDEQDNSSNPLSLDEAREAQAAVLNSNHEPPMKLPFDARWPVLVGAIIGILLRLLFSNSFRNVFETMSGAFIYLVPMSVGAITVYIAERKERRTWGYYLRAPMAANTLFVLGTLLVLLEGLICAILIVPLFPLAAC
jgi:drug/metabolite transporter (DMT)-like permease